MNILLLLLVLFAQSSISYAQGLNDELFDMDLEALMNIEISVASKRLEGVSQAPGVINVITAEEIRSYGGRRLIDILDRVPGVYVYGSVSFPNNVVSIRGQSNNVVDTHTLFLINNRPLKNGFNGGDNRTILSGFPVDMIERIEVIRGPGSVLYGTNAFAGVVNIVTKKAKKELQGSVSGGYGTFDSKSGDFSVAGKNEESDLNYHLSGTYYDSDGWDFEGFDAAGTFSSEEYVGYGHGIAGNLEYGDFKLNVFRSGAKDPTITTYPKNFVSADWTYVDLGYEYEFNKNWTAVTNFAYSDYSINYQNFLIGSTGDVLFEETIKGELSKKLHVVFGVSANYLDGEESSSSGFSYSSNRYTGYVQADYLFQSWLKFVAGVQFNKTENVDLDASPRLGVIANFNENWGTKLLYGKAFRDAYPTELFINNPGLLVGNSSLDPETIQTIDWQVYYQSAKYYSALTLFRSWQRNTIDLVGITYENSTGIDSYGFELEGRAQVSSGLSLQGSLSLQENEATDNVSDAYENPNILAKLGLDYKSRRGYSFGVFNSYIGATELNSSRTSLLNPDSDGYHWLTAHLMFDLNTLLDRKQWPTTTISLYGGNLLNVDAYGPADTTVTLNTTLVRPGRYVLTSLKVNF